ncbi:MAG: alpha/beta fold hydrolase [Gemmatirosa sp.]|nr:alpha/beta fold hydrolase [Gemmatirosa sp.]
MPHPSKRAIDATGRWLVRRWFGTLSRVAPRRAERQAARLVLTPRRRTPRDPVVSGVTARPLQLEAAGHAIAGWSWGAGPTVLLVHGWSGRAADLAPVAAGLVAAGFRAVAVDMPAHGRSPGRQTSLAEWVVVLPALVAQLGDDGAAGIHAVVAHSFGAAGVTLALEAGLPARGAVLLAPAQGPAQFLERIRRFIGLPAARHAGMERTLVAAVGRELAYFDAARAAAGLRLPALILHDPADPEVAWRQAESIARAWRGSRLVAVEGDGHYGILRAPHVVRDVVRFVAALRADAAGATA